LAPASAEPATPGPTPEADAAPRSFVELVALVLNRRELHLHLHLRQHVRLVRFAPERLELHALPGAPADLQMTLTQKLRAWTGRQWLVVLNEEAEGEPSLREQEDAVANDLRESVGRHPLVRAALAAFPQARIERIADLPGHAARPPDPPSAEDDMEDE